MSALVADPPRSPHELAPAYAPIAGLADGAIVAFQATSGELEREEVLGLPVVVQVHAGTPLGAVRSLHERGLGVMIGEDALRIALLDVVPVAMLKVDVTGLPDEHPTTAGALRALVDVARPLGATAVAAGVDTEASLRAVAHAGFVAVQGALIGRPVGVAGAQELVRDGLDPRVESLLRGSASGAAGLAAPGESPADGPALTLAQACEALGVSISTLRRWADAGRIRAVRTAGGHRRFPASEIRRVSHDRRSDEAPAVRPVAATSPPAPLAAQTLQARGTEIVRLAAAATYRDGRGGWFASEAARPALREWLAIVAAACRTGNHESAGPATERLLAAAALPGTPLLERDVFLERFVEVSVRAAAAAGAGREETVAMHRLGRHLRQVGLALADGTVVR